MKKLLIAMMSVASLAFISKAEAINSGTTFENYAGAFGLVDGIGDVMLSLYLSIALMTLKLWELSGLIGLVPNQFAADGYDVIYSIYNACVAAGVDGSTSAADACAKLIAYFGTYEFTGLTGSGMTWDASGMISKIPAAVKIENGKYVDM